MRRLLLINKLGKYLCTLILLSGLFASNAFAKTAADTSATIDRIQLVKQQMTLLDDRVSQNHRELKALQAERDEQLAEINQSNISKTMLDKAALDISVATSNVNGAAIELEDAKQTVNWLEKNVQEISNQLDMLTIFSLKTTGNDVENKEELRSDLTYQQKLLTLEKERVSRLQALEDDAKRILQVRKDSYNRLNSLLQSRKLLHMKQQQSKDELLYQQQQHDWLQKLATYSAALSHTDPSKERTAYAALERNIFYANESASLAHAQSLIARYQDQIQQIRISALRSESISLFNELGKQVQQLGKQISRLEATLEARMKSLESHRASLATRKKDDTVFSAYLRQLSDLSHRYQTTQAELVGLNKSLASIRSSLDLSLQSALSARQGMPTFGTKIFIDLGKEGLLLPPLTFQIGKSFYTYLMKGIYATPLIAWGFFITAYAIFFVLFLFARRYLAAVLARPSKWRDQINSKWLSLQWLYRSSIDLYVIGTLFAVMAFFGIPAQSFIFIYYLSLVWLIFKAILIIARLCLVETTHDAGGQDIRLYHRLRWIILIGGIITGLTVFVHQLPLIYELSALFDRLFLILLMGVSILLLRSYDVVPNLILSHMKSKAPHPYLRGSIRLIGFLVPLLIFCNAVIGLFGFVNLIMTVSWYQGIFLIVLIGYLLLRGLLLDGMEQLSSLVIQYVNNGWLWTEAVLKPIDRVLRITLFLVGWAVLFLLYGWDKQSPIVERLTRLLHYNLVTALNTTITPLSIIELCIVISIFYWTARWTREFVFRLLASRTMDMGIRNSIAIFSQYTVIFLGGFICLQVLGIDLRALAAIAAMLAFGIGFGLRDLANNFVCGFFILLERPLRVGDIVNINGIEGEVVNFGSRAVTICTWDNMELLVPNAEIFNKTFTNWTSHDDIVRSVLRIQVDRQDNPHEIAFLIEGVLARHPDVLKEPRYEVYLKEMTDTLLNFEVRYFVNIRVVRSRMKVMSSVHVNIWDEFAKHHIKPPYPQHEVVLKENTTTLVQVLPPQA